MVIVLPVSLLKAPEELESEAWRGAGKENGASNRLRLAGRVLGGSKLSCLWFGEATTGLAPRRSTLRNQDPRAEERGVKFLAPQEAQREYEYELEFQDLGVETASHVCNLFVRLL